MFKTKTKTFTDCAQRHKIIAADGLMSMIATMKCKSVEAVPDTLRWSFDGLKPASPCCSPKACACQRCGARDHKVAECTSPRTYASTMRGDMDVGGEDYDNDNEEQRGLAPASQPTAESTANNQEQRPTDQPTEIATADGVGDGAGVTSQRPEAAVSKFNTDSLPLRGNPCTSVLYGAPATVCCDSVTLIFAFIIIIIIIILQVKKQTPHFRTSGAHCAIFPKLCMLIELVETIKKCGIIF